MKFQENFLGVKFLGNYVAIESADPFGDLSKYDFFYTDFLSSDFNANYCYGSNIRVLNGQDLMLPNEWKLIRLYFPGNWSGNTGRCELEDKYGKRITIDGAGLAIYANSYKYMVRESLIKAIEFAESTPCVDFKLILNGIQKKSGQISLDEFHKHIEEVDNYVAKYKNLKENLSEEEKDKYLAELNDAVSNNISKLFDLDIIIN